MKLQTESRFNGLSHNHMHKLSDQGRNRPGTKKTCKMRSNQISGLCTAKGKTNKQELSQCTYGRKSLTGLHLMGD